MRSLSRPLASFLALSLVSLAQAGTRADAFRTLFRSQASRRLIEVEAPVLKLRSLGLDLARHGTEAPGETVAVVAGPEELEILERAGISYQESLQEFAPRTLEDWSSFEAVEGRIDALVAKHPDIFYAYSIGTSIEGRPIRTVRVSSTPRVQDPERPKVSINANHHAREVMTVEAALDVLSEIAKGKLAKDPRTLSWLQGVELYVTPVVNPDGYAYVHQNHPWWRKNRRKNADGSFGVDLNRNYPYAWGANDRGSSPRPSSETYRGAHAMSEPEAKALVGLARRIQPLFNLSYHSYGEVLLYPYGYENAKNPEGDIIEELSTELAGNMVRDTGSGTYDKRSRLYPVNGLDRDWYYFELGTYSFVPEISNRSRGFHPSYQWVKPTVEGLRGGWKFLMDRSLQAGIHGRVFRKDTGAPLVARVRVQEVRWRNGEVHRSDLQGAFHKLLKPGKYQLLIEAAGFLPAKVPVEVKAGKLARVRVELTPSGRAPGA